MLEYFYDTDTKEFTYSAEIFTDPLESQNAGHDVYMFSANATTLEPLEPKDGFAVIFNGSEWEYVEDHRGTIVWKSHEESMEIREVGAIPDGWSTEQPEKPLDVNDYDAIMEQHITDTRFARGYTTREPTEFLSSSIPRWKQDAEDFVLFRDTVLAYGLEVMNHYAATGEAPTLEEFKNNLPNIVWTYSQ